MDYTYQDNGERQELLRNVKTVVIKVGTQLLTDMAGESKEERVRRLVEQIAELRSRGIAVILVSSGAIGAGMTVLQNKDRPRGLSDMQAHAAVGQSRLMYLYETACNAFGFHCGQLLLTAGDVQSRDRHLNTSACLKALLEKGVLPIINENDTVSVEAIRFGDNDILAALVAAMIKADLTILLTTVDGMQEFDMAGGEHPQARISLVSRITPSLRAMASGTDGNKFSTGGMTTKLRAAEIVTTAGEGLWIADGTRFDFVESMFAGQDVGTLFLPAKSDRMKGRERYLAFFSGTAGEALIDAGAIKALTEDGSSLLPSGIKAIRGEFERGQTILIADEDGSEVARGITNYSSEELNRIKGLRTDAARAALEGPPTVDEVVHRNSMVLTR